jgi:DNA segregation ATPase FtsK/SpoIIIE-like protein
MTRFIKFDDRKRHIYLSGKTQYGKTTAMISMAYQDMRNDLGLCFVDYKGVDLSPRSQSFQPAICPLRR